MVQSTVTTYLTQPERLEYELKAKGSVIKTVFIDEVQKVPALLDTIQTLIDAQPAQWRFFLSVSSARKLRRGHANLLPGRIHLYNLSPLVARELGKAFDFTRVLAHGTLPGIYAEQDGELRAQDLRGYVDAYLREEIQAEALVRNYSPIPGSSRRHVAGVSHPSMEWKSLLNTYSFFAVFIFSFQYVRS